MRRRQRNLSIEGLRAYQREQAHLYVGRLRIGSLIGAVLVPAFGVLDVFAFPEQAHLFIAVRLAVAGSLAAIFWMSTRPSLRPWSALLGIVAVVLVGMMINVMIRLTGGYASPYYAGLSLAFLIASVIARFNVREATIACGACYVAYLLGIVVFDTVDDFGLLVNNNFFLLSSLLVALVGAYLAENIRRKEFLARFTLLQANRKLRDLDQLKSQFFASVSHELRTPLTLLLAPTESLLADEAGPLPPLGRRFVELIHANALKLLREINDLLDLARLDARRMELSPAPLDLGELVSGLVRAAEPLARQRGLALDLTVQRTVDTLLVDGEKVEKVLLNLLSNALKFTPPGGRVEVTLVQAASGARISVTDTGIGIAAKDLDRIFDRFAQVDASATRRYPGSGIGLALVKELVELHGGWVTVESEPGVGSTFSATLPALSAGAPSTGQAALPNSGGVRVRLADLADSAPSLPARGGLEGGDDEVAAVAAAGGRELLLPAARLGRPRPARARGPRATVVVMEDNRELCEFLVALLAQRYRVVTAADGEEGLAVVRSIRPDLVLADVMMPGKSGLDVCREIKDDPDEALARTPVLLLTAKAELAQRLEGYEQGADDYLVKPFNSKELLARVRVLLRLRALEQALAHRNRELAGELSATRDQLIQSEKLNAVGQLAAGVAHEINNPLTSVISFAQLLLKGRVSELDARRCLELIASEGERAAKIVRGLLAFARRHTPERSLQNLRQVLESVLELREYAFRKADIAVERHYEDLPAVMVDPHQMQQVFLNILVNAEQALAERRGGTLRVRTERGAGTVRVAIADDGPGIAPEDLPRIFEPFFSTKDVGQGTGLGLSICYGIVQEHHGRIWAESEPGRGATFVIELPLEATEDEARAAGQFATLPNPAKSSPVR